MSADDDQMHRSHTHIQFNEIDENTRDEFAEEKKNRKEQNNISWVLVMISK